MPSPSQPAALRVAGPRFSPAASRLIARGLLPIVALVATAAGCTRSAVPYPGAVLPSTLTAAALAPRAPRIPFSGQLAAENPHAIFGIAEGEGLTVRPVAGVEGSASGTLAFNQRGLHLTGRQTALGSSIWVEVVRPEGGTGWVNALNLTEDVAPQAFCADPRVLQLLDATGAAVIKRDGASLADLTSPRRGLRVRFDWRGPEVVYSRTDVTRLFQATDPEDWGVHSSGAAIGGSFTEVVLPLLDRAFGPQSVLTCDVVGTGSILREVSWPSEYTNMNYYSFYRPAEEGGSEYSWATWLAGVEYIEGQPYLAILVLLRAGI